jgi:AcrR family transcriptional regulator
MSTQTRQRLIDTAFELFALHGFHAVGLDRILGESGLTKTTFYNHFESKDHLVREVIRYRDTWEIDLMRRLLREHGGEEPARQLGAVFLALHGWFTSPEFRGCIFISAAAEFPSPNDPSHQAAADHQRALRNLLCDLAIRAGAHEPEVLADQMLLLIEGAIIVRHVTGNLAAALTGDALAKALLERHLPQGHPSPDER